MKNTLSIHSYTDQRASHFHDWHQLVLPLKGVIDIEIPGFAGSVRPGECVFIHSGQLHHFKANAKARFVVADMHHVPWVDDSTGWTVFSLSQPMVRYLEFIAAQLEHQVNPDLEHAMMETFTLLLAEQEPHRQLSARIRQVQEHIASHLQDSLTITDLAAVACLSPTQFKKVFREQTGLSPLKYMTQVRMDKAKALLMHTDYPVQQVAEQVGYSDLSAFSRRFSSYFGLSPRAFFQS
ncbi:AraC family transcriptional regulator [Parendozoicomonas haliclonae]|uniref:Arabinose operon regulatory protein n=1 Tax=Parendozoicomonas haliclonae TaxID=1960125 RepID=A0A1X7AIM4_9GAMM|nr:AraC family transcriptional regulator [Parendozoicomonas haliclonae]SMA45492.1 Arabinose operon regulatory protein [Parendozoicomonas haliclonae]